MLFRSCLASREDEGVHLKNRKNKLTLVIQSHIQTLKREKGKIMEELLQKIIPIIPKQERLLIGIAGPGAAGKTTFAEKLMKLLNVDVNYLNTDPYIVTGIRNYTTIDYVYQHKQYSSKMTACHPMAHNRLALERDLRMLREGMDFYTMDTAYSKSTLLSSQKQVSIVEGMSVAFLNPNLFDLTIYFYSDEETELTRRKLRDISERGRKLKSLLASQEQRRIQYELFMHPYRNNFDIIVENSNQQMIVKKWELTNGI